MIEAFTGEKLWKKYNDYYKIRIALQMSPEKILNGYDKNRPEYGIIESCCMEDVEARIDIGDLLKAFKELQEKY